MGTKGLSNMISYSDSIDSLLAKSREWRDIPDGYNFKQFKAFAEAEIGRICGIKDKH